MEDIIIYLTHTFRGENYNVQDEKWDGWMGLTSRVDIVEEQISDCEYMETTKMKQRKKRL